VEPPLLDFVTNSSLQKNQH